MIFSLKTTKPASKKREKGKKNKSKKKKNPEPTKTKKKKPTPSPETKQCSDSRFNVWVSKEGWYDCECK